MDDMVIRYVSALGFPIVSAIAVSYALYKIGVYLAKALVSNIETNAAEMRLQTKALHEIRDALPAVCKADCPVAECDGLRQRGKR